MLHTSWQKYLKEIAICPVVVLQRRTASVITQTFDSAPPITGCPDTEPTGYRGHLLKDVKSHTEDAECAT